LSKIHEENVRGTIVEIIEYFEKSTLKGEIVIIVAGQKDLN
jgi:16S rRNA (cytidine1402-2'-O)-methyltransferase